MNRIITFPGSRGLVRARNMGDITRLADMIVPEVFGPYVQQLTQEKSNLIRSGAVVSSPALSNLLVGGGLTFNSPSFRDLENSVENISSDTGADSTPNNIRSSKEIQVRLSRNNSWGSADLVSNLIGTDPMNAIANRVADYWVRRQQVLFVATQKGVLANNALADDEFHKQNDMIHDVSAVGGILPSHIINAAGTMGDSLGMLSMMMVHSVVYLSLQKQNLIDFIPDARGEVDIPTYMGRRVIIDDGMPNAGGVFDTWLFGTGAYAMGVGSAKVPVEVERNPAANQGGGEEILHNRVEWILHPVGHAFSPATPPPAGGPKNDATAGNLANANTWRRAFTERKQIRMAALRTKEF